MKILNIFTLNFFFYFNLAKKNKIKDQQLNFFYFDNNKSENNINIISELIKFGKILNFFYL